VDNYYAFSLAPSRCAQVEQMHVSGNEDSFSFSSLVKVNDLHQQAFVGFSAWQLLSFSQRGQLFLFIIHFSPYYFHKKSG